MSTTLRLGRATFLGVLLASGSAPADADESIGRRLAALRVLVGPMPGRGVDPQPAQAPSTCPGSAWWRTSEYAIRSHAEAAVRDASLRFRVSEDLIRSVIRHESAWNPEAVSHAGAMGLMQLMPATAEALGVICPFDPRENVLGGTRYLREMRDLLGSWTRAVAAYHAGPARVALGEIPDETRRYVRRVIGTWDPHRSVELD